MGDIVALLAPLNLSPVITVLLAVVVYFVWSLVKRVEFLEKHSIKHGVTLAVIKNKLSIEIDD